MNIFFDIHVENPSFFDNLSPEGNIIFERIFLYVYNRVKILEAEFTKEEQEDAGRAILIYVKTTPKAIQPKGYSEELIKKFETCFSPNDTILMWNSVNDGLQSVLN